MAEPVPAEEAPLEPLNLAPVARVLAVGGLALVVISAFLEWAGRNFPRSFGGMEVPAKFLIDSKSNLDGAGLPLGVLVLVIAAVGLVGAFAPIPRRNLLVWVSGALAALIALVFLYQLNDFMDRFNRVFGPGGFGARNTVGFGAALCGFGGVVTLAGAALGLYVARRPNPSAADRREP
jgi:hypothetical protein